MNVLAVCPSKIATGGTESIHKFVNELNKQDGIEAVILYAGDPHDPQPREYECYGCEYVTSLPDDYRGVIIFPEIYGDAVASQQHKDCVKVINWAGWDVYQWNVPKQRRWMFLKNENVIHLAQSEYAMRQLENIGLKPMKLSDVLHDDFFEPYEEEERNDVVLYNPAKMTDFYRKVIKASPFDCRPIMGLSRAGVIDALRHAKLYIDFGAFSGRERLPREAAMCGCCVLTSKTGAAQYFYDVSIHDEYKFDDTQLDEVIETMKDIIANYDVHRPFFNVYRSIIKQDRESFKSEVSEIAKVFLERL